MCCESYSSTLRPGRDVFSQRLIQQSKNLVPISTQALRVRLGCLWSKFSREFLNKPAVACLCWRCLFFTVTHNQILRAGVQGCVHRECWVSTKCVASM